MKSEQQTEKVFVRLGVWVCIPVCCIQGAKQTDGGITSMWRRIVATITCKKILLSRKAGGGQDGRSVYTIVCFVQDNETCRCLREALMMMVTVNVSDHGILSRVWKIGWQ